MPTFRIWMYGQSNMVWLNNTTPGSPVADTLLPVLRALVDPTQAEAVIDRVYDLTGTCFSGIGSAFANVAMTPDAAGTYGAASGVHLVRPRAPTDPQFADWAAWPLTANGQARITWAEGQAPAIKDEVGCILAMHNEYDTRGYAVNGWAQNDPRVVEFAWRRMLGALRTALGKTAAACPVLASVPVPYTPGSDAGFDAANIAIRTLAADPAFNLHIIAAQTMDCTWDRDGPAGAYTWHANNADLALLARRFACGIARVMGPLWAPGSFRSRPHLGPRIAGCQQIDASTIDVWIAHDGGATLRLPASPTLGWRVRYNGQPVTVAAAEVQPDGRRIRLGLASPCAAASMLAVEYGAGNLRLLPAGAVYDDASGFDAKAIAAGVTGADRLDGALARTVRPVPVRTTPPTL